jgi:Fe-S-cluster containining protein
MIDFDCSGCDFCCTKLTWEEKGIARGITIFEDEKKHFPEWAIFPLFRNRQNIFAYQLGEYSCPMLRGGKCGIYGNHPLVCKSFPVCHKVQRGLIVDLDRCFKIMSNREEDFDYKSFEGCFSAAREREKREMEWPEASEIFSLRTKSWVKI